MASTSRLHPDLACGVGTSYCWSSFATRARRSVYATALRARTRSCARLSASPLCLMPPALAAPAATPAAVPAAVPSGVPAAAAVRSAAPAAYVLLCPQIVLNAMTASAPTTVHDATPATMPASVPAAVALEVALVPGVRSSRPAGDGAHAAAPPLLRQRSGGASVRQRNDGPMRMTRAFGETDAERAHFTCVHFLKVHYSHSLRCSRTSQALRGLRLINSCTACNLYNFEKYIDQPLIAAAR